MSQSSTWLPMAKYEIAKLEYVLGNPEFRQFGEVEKFEYELDGLTDAAHHINGGDWCEEMREAKEAVRMMEEAAKRLRAQYFPNAPPRAYR